MKSRTLNRPSAVWTQARGAPWEGGQNAIASHGRNGLACEPLTKAARPVDRPLGDLRRDAKPLAQLTVGEEPEARNEQSGGGGGDAVVDTPWAPSPSLAR